MVLRNIIKIDEANCTGYDKCGQICPNQIAVDKKKIVYSVGWSAYFWRVDI